MRPSRRRPRQRGQADGELTGADGEQGQPQPGVQPVPPAPRAGGRQPPEHGRGDVGHRRCGDQPRPPGHLRGGLGPAPARRAPVEVLVDPALRHPGGLAVQGRGDGLTACCTAHAGIVAADRSAVPGGVGRGSARTSGRPRRRGRPGGAGRAGARDAGRRVAVVRRTSPTGRWPRTSPRRPTCGRCRRWPGSRAAPRCAPGCCRSPAGSAPTTCAEARRGLVLVGEDTDLAALERDAPADEVGGPSPPRTCCDRLDARAARGLRAHPAASGCPTPRRPRWWAARSARSGRGWPGPAPTWSRRWSPPTTPAPAAPAELECPGLGK